MLDSTTFLFGEKKRVCVRVRSTNRQPFEVTEAKFELRSGDEVEAVGDCTLNHISETEMMIDALIEPKRPNSAYVLRYYYTIPPEELIHQVQVRVC